MIWDLLKISSNAVFNRRKVGYNNVDRWTGDDAFNYLLNSDDDNIPTIDGQDEGGIYSGVSMICVDLGGNNNKENTEYHKD